jgi:hypothetical protein
MTGRPGDTGEQGFFDASLRADLERLAHLPARPTTQTGAVSLTLNQKLARFLALPPAGAPMSEDEFVALPDTALTERINLLLELCRESTKPEARQAADNFVAFFRTLVPTLSEAGSVAIKRVFYRLVPSLLQIAFRDFSNDPEQRQEGALLLGKLERILLEISHVQLAPSESELVFQSIDQLTGLFAVGEYAMADGLVASQLLGIIQRNKVMRSLFRIMEVEAAVQEHLRTRLGHATTRMRIPHDLPALREYGPLCVFPEPGSDGRLRNVVQVHLPNIPFPQNVLLLFHDESSRQTHSLRLDPLGCAGLDLPDGDYRLGLAYEPADPQR